MNDKLEMIRMGALSPHPENPRKDVGDIEELTESIRKNGLMQNLTVVKGKWDSRADNGTGDINPYAPGYTILIGHRRFAAAKAAGLTEVPCRVVEKMDKKEQLSTMLEENMQRTDLSVYEQAQGFQMMMDLGQTEEDLVEKTGFSRTTIKHRLNLAKLDSEVLKEKQDNEAYQISIMDLYELEKVKDIDKRNEILKNSTSSKDIAWRVSSTVREQKWKDKLEQIIRACKTAGIRELDLEEKTVKWSFNQLVTIRVDDDIADKIAEACDKVEDSSQDCAYYESYESVVIVDISFEQNSSEENKVDPEELERRRKRATIKHEAEETLDMLKDRSNFFVEQVLEGDLGHPKWDMDIFEEMLDAMIKTNATLRRILIERVTKDNMYGMSKEAKEAAFDEIDAMTPLNKMLVIIAEAIYDIDDVVGWDSSYDQETADECKKAFEIFRHWGWSPLSEEEQKLMDGTAEVYEVDDE